MNDLMKQVESGSVLQGCQNGECEQNSDDDVRELSVNEMQAIVGGNFAHKASALR